jgi:tetratricopeptide (TPR) repeat protein
MANASIVPPAIVPQPPAVTPRPRSVSAIGDTSLIKTIGYVAAVVAITFACFCRVSNPVHSFDFVDWDDMQTIALNKDFNPPSVEGLLRYWKEPSLDLYIPMTYTAWYGIAMVAKQPVPDERNISLDAYEFHAANLLLHLIGAAMVFAILRLLVPSEWAAVFGALLWALHPVQVEPVAWVSGLKDVLCGCFSLLAIWQYLLYATRRQEGEDARAWQVPYLIATVALVIAMLSKPSAVTVPFIVGAIDIFLLRRPREEVQGPLWIWFLLSLVFVVIGRMAQPATILPFSLPVWFRPVLAGYALFFHLFHVFVPLHLATDYGKSPDVLIGNPWVYAAWIIPAGVIALSWIFRRKLNWLFVSMIVFIAAVLPVLGLLPFDFQYYSTVADRYVYVAMLGPALALGFVLSRYPRIWLIGPAAVVLGCLGFLTFQQTGHWQDTRSLFAHTVSVNPKSFVGHMMMGAIHSRDKRDADAIDAYNVALSVKPDDAHAHYNLANIYVREENIRAALPHYEAAVRRMPNDADVHFSYGSALARIGNYDAAAEHFAAALSNDPNYDEARTNLALSHMALASALAEKQNWTAAIPHYEAALKADPTMITAQTGLAEAKRRLGSRGNVIR